MKKEELYLRLNDILEDLEKGNVRSAKKEVVYLINQVGFI